MTLNFHMLRHTFIHLPGIGAHREQSLWAEGIVDWEHFLEAAARGELSERLRSSTELLVRQSLEACAGGDVKFFRDLLPRKEAWRLYPEFAEQALFLDIETTGLAAQYHDVTMIGALGRGELSLFIHGINLDQFPDYVAQFPLLVTFNGSQFDVPFLRAHFPQARLDQAHIDLRFVLGSLGFRGGLKSIEKQLGLSRDPAIAGVDGWEAVRLWYRYRRGDLAALATLALYNLTDVVNLVELVDIAVDLHRRRLNPRYSPPPPGQSLVHLRYDPEHLASWILQELGRQDETPSATRPARAASQPHTTHNPGSQPCESPHSC
ncbi:MAG: ribonuclease H-like domain-containing protein [Thermoguttaceae bacterium]